MKYIYLILCAFTSTLAFGQFTSVADGDWNDGGTWGNTSPGIEGVHFPSAGQNAVINSMVTIPALYTATITDLNIGAGYTLTIDASGMLNLNGVLTIDDDGLGGLGFLDLKGTLSANDGSSFVGDSESTISVTGIYQHNFTATAGSIVQALWNTGSECQIVGYTTNTTLPANFDQVYYNFTWACTNFTGPLVPISPVTVNTTFFALDGLPAHILGNFRVSRTGNTTTAHARTLRFFDAGNSMTMAIEGNLIIENSARLVLTSTGTANVLTIGGSFQVNNTPISGGSSTNTLTGGGSVTVTVTGDLSVAPAGNTTLAFAGAASGTSTLNVNGNVSLAPTSGTATVNLGGNASASGTLNVKGSFSMNSSSVITRTAGTPTGVSTINFNGTTTQVYSNAGAITNAINYIVAAGSKLDVGTSILSGTGSFTLSSDVNSALFLGSTDPSGAIQNVTTAGNIRTPVGTRTFGALSKIVYKSTSAQFIGNGQPPTAITEIQNAAGVTLVTDIDFSNSLTLTSGNLTIGDGVTARTLTLSGNFTPNSNSIGVTNQSDLIINGTGTIGILSTTGSNIKNLIINHSAGVTLGSNLTVDGSLTLTSGNLTISDGVTPAMLTLAGTFTPNSNFLGLNSQSGLTIAGSGAFGTLAVTGTSINNLTINRTLSGTVTLGSDLTVSGLLTQTAGNIVLNGHTLTINSYSGGAGSFVVDNLASMVINGTGAFGSLQTSGTTLSNFTLNRTSGGSVTLGSDLSVTGTLTQTAGDIIMNGKTLTLAGYSRTAGNFVTDAAASFVINGSGPFGNLVTTGTTSIANLTLNRSGLGASVVLGNDLTITGNYLQTVGDLDLNGFTLTLSGPVYVNTGTFLVNSASSLIINGSGSFGYTSVISFGGAQALNTFTLNRGGMNFSTASNLTVTNLNLLDVSYSNGATLTMASGGTLTRGFGSLVNLVSPAGTVTAATSYDVVYNNSIFPYANGVELPSNATGLRNLTKLGSNQLNLAQSITINGDLTLSAGQFDAGANAIELKGNFVSNANSALASSAITFSGNTAISGAVTPVFGAVTISSTGTLTPSSNFQINGNLINDGTLNTGSATTTFGGSTTISGSQTCSFNNIIISSSLTAPGGASSFNVAGTFTNNGFFVNNGSTVVFNGTSTIGGTSPTNFGSVTVTGALTAPTTLNVARNFTNNGVFTAGAGTTLVLNGTSQQNIQGTTVTNFRNITVTNIAGPPSVQVQSNQNLLGILTLASDGTNGTIFDADGSGNTSVFTMVSSADGADWDNTTSADASIAALPTGTVRNAGVSGNVTVQRYMSIEGPGSRIYRFISSPVTNAPVSWIQNFIPVTGAFSGTSACGTCGTRPSMFTYDETLAGDLTVGYTQFPVSANSEMLQPAQGYSIFARGNIAPISTAGSALWSVRGPINAGNVTPIAFPVSFTPQNGVADDGWNLIGNPFPSTIDWNAASGWAKSTDIQGSIYMTDNAAGVPPTYITLIASWNGLIGTNGGSRYIPVGQAFFVKSNGTATPSITADEGIKSPGSPAIYFRQALPANALRVTLSQNTLHDETVIHFRPDATENFDGNADAYKLKNSIFNLATLTQDLKLAINSLPPLECNRIVKLDVSDVVPGTYHFEFSNVESFDQSIKILVHDALAGEDWVDIKSHSGFDFEVSSDSSTFGSDRFVISFGYDLPTALELKAEGICGAFDSVIEVDHSLTSLTYFAEVNGVSVTPVTTGNGHALLLPIKQSDLKFGSNIVKIVSQSPNCATLVYSQNVTVKVDSVYRAKSAGGSSCREGAVTLVAAGGPTGGAYNWYEGETDTEPLLDSVAIFITPVLSKTKTYYVSALNANGCEGIRIPVVATVVNYDDAVISEEDENTLHSNYAHGNRWYFNGTLLPDTTATLKLGASGLYRLEVKVATCTTSDEKTFIVTDLESGFKGITSYPNPVKGMYTVEVIDQENQIIEMPIFNTLGSQIGSMKVTTLGSLKKGQFDFGSYASGMYYIKVVRGANVSVLKVIKN